MTRKKIGLYTALSLIILISIIVITYLFDWVLGATDPTASLGQNGQLPDGTTYTWGHLVKNNKYGFREDAIPMPKPENTYRIMVLGDSFTWGAGLAPAERYTNVLEELLNKTVDGVNVEVLNFGLAGGPTVQERDDFRKYKDIFKPDLVILGFCINDPQPKSMIYSVEREAFGVKHTRSINQYVATLSDLGLTTIAAKLPSITYSVAETFDVIPTWPESLQRSYEKKSDNWQSFVVALTDIYDMSAEMNLPKPIFISLNQGSSTTSASDYNNPDKLLNQFIRWYDQAEVAAKEIGFVTVNVKEELAENYHDKSMAVNILDGHPNKDLNEFYAKKLADAIRPMLNKFIANKKDNNSQ